MGNWKAVETNARWTSFPGVKGKAGRGILKEIAGQWKRRKSHAAKLRLIRITGVRLFLHSRGTRGTLRQPPDRR